MRLVVWASIRYHSEVETEGPLPPVGVKPPEDEEVPRVAVRLDLGSVRITEAEALARSSAEALIARADLHGAESPWVIEESPLRVEALKSVEQRGIVDHDRCAYA